MAELKIYGASDDLIEVEGALREEFSYYSTNWELQRFLAVSDGTLLRVSYDEDGIWRFIPLVVGSSTLDFSIGMDDRLHSDVIRLTGDEFTWVVLADQVIR